MTQPIRDSLGRPLRDLRISVTDRCNMRCRYCMPREIFGPNFTFLPRSELLTFEEITRIAAAFIRAGVRKIRLTGGEPLLRADLPRLVAMLADLPDVHDLALTTNGSLLARYARPLRDAGLRRVTVSLDTLNPATFSRLADTDIPLDNVLAGIDAAQSAGFFPIKLNAVIRRGVNDGDVEELAAFARDNGHIMRFIEYMDVGNSNGWRAADVVPAAEIIARISSHWPIDPLPPRYPGEVANRFRYRDGRGEFGVIASITQPFCRDCTRLRLSAVGEVFTCLFAVRGHDLRSIVRSNTDSAAIDAALDEAITRIWSRRSDRYSELRALDSDGSREDADESEASAVPGRSTHPGHRKVEMSYIGG
ncbi:GTP cyclohydrolase subunit MoaA [Acidothermus cellulolyticus 11B]|uniref:GTP 3',8-cyclase n=1 Tax=Acidothermus cellulolyticus (strain ATCC 43068 / DSM 8971 / 11B) TaxID=351607 RepID=MOAA_ACIC1|nr:GTP 3',8-cyclase MoaA [Acidothermus cellulolyticus]A0LVG0.1 RecName: Full=GTP 3',8-cyclase; AltName: Full=Molybdenum cofactor biosynthesis protein A [Acidothermus cellulolyticus 11B]ABK53420.1 GTP cyclohydrolase subunit MoaA [Acidothermus cellulolyticus 11B]